MSGVGGGFRLCPASNYIVQGSGSNDVLVFASTSNQNIVFGTSNNSNLLVRINSNGFVGVGLSNPGFRLDVLGDLNFSGVLRQGGVPYVGSQWSNSGTSVFLLGSNVGIGVSNPGAQLHVGSNLRVDGALQMANYATFGGIDFMYGGTLSNAGGVILTTSNIQGYSNLVWGASGSNGTQYSIMSNTSNDVFRWVAGAASNEIMRLNGAGMLGIGAAAPSSILHLASNGLANVYITLCNASTGSLPAVIGISNNGDMLLSTASNDNIIFVTSNAERVRIGSNGYVGIGNSNPQYPIDISGNTNIGTSTLSLTTSNTVPATPVAYYAFNSAAPMADSVGTYTLVATGTYAQVPGVSGGGAIHLTNQNGAVAPTNFVRYAAGITNAPPLSVSCWFNTSIVPANLAPIFAVGGSTSGNAGVSVRFNNSLQLQMATYTNGGNLYQALSTVATNTWYHVAATMSSSNITIYVNGVQVHQTANMGPITTFPSGNQFALGGCSGDTAGGGMTGMIDEVRVYNRVLTAAEVGSLAGLVSTSASASNTALHVASAAQLSAGSLTAGSIASTCFAIVNRPYIHGWCYNNTNNFGQDTLFTWNWVTQNQWTPSSWSVNSTTLSAPLTGFYHIQLTTNTGVNYGGWGVNTGVAVQYTITGAILVTGGVQQGFASCSIKTFPSSEDNRTCTGTVFLSAGDQFSILTLSTCPYRTDTGALVAGGCVMNVSQGNKGALYIRYIGNYL